jgi:hypothetical protein
LKLVSPDAFRMSVEEAVVFRGHASLTTNALIKIDSVFRNYHGQNLFPTRLKKKLHDIAEATSLAVQVKLKPLIISKETNLVKMCAVSWLVDPPKIVEKLTESAIIGKKFEDSQSFSKLKDCLVVPFCWDKGGNDYAMLVRVANRELGNTTTHSQPLCQFEGAAECYENCASAVFCEESPVKDFHQDLVDDRFYVF